MRKWRSQILLFLLIVLSACSDSDDVRGETSSEGEVSSFTWSAACDTYKIEIDVSDEWQINLDADWLFVPDNQLLGEDKATISVYVEQNPNDEHRVANITLSGRGRVMKTWRITQLGRNEGGDNATFTSDLGKTYAVGWGYNAFGEYAAENDIRAQVINYEKLVSYEQLLNQNIVTDEEQYDLSYNKEVAFSMSEFSRTITKETNVKTKILFYKKEVKKRTTNTTSTKNECSFATLSVMNVVAQRYFSESAVQMLLDNGKDILTDDFKRSVRNVRDGEMSPKDFVQKYGTDVVLAAWLGGRLDYTTTIKKTTTTEIEQVVTTTYKKLFGKSSSMTEEERKFSEKIDVDYDCTCHVKGGNTTRLEREIQSKISKKQPIDDNIFLDWENSFHDASSMLKSGNAALIETRTIPIYELITDKDVRHLIEKEINVQADNDTFSSEEDADKCYVIRIPDNIDAVRLAQHNGKVVAEICKEFVPSVRSDRQVVVVYPILSDGKPNHERGYFIGDGEANAPGRIMWKGGKSYYYRDDSFGACNVVNTMYLYCEDIKPQHEDYMPMTENTEIVPANSKIRQSFRIVKIGGQYWGYDENATYAYPKMLTMSVPGYIWPTKSDLSILQQGLLNDYSLMFEADGRSGLNLPNKSCWLVCDKAIMCIFTNGTCKQYGKGKRDGVGLLLVRNKNYGYDKGK